MARMDFSIRQMPPQLGVGSSSETRPLPCLEPRFNKSSTSFVTWLVALPNLLLALVLLALTPLIPKAIVVSFLAFALCGALFTTKGALRAVLMAIGSVSAVTFLLLLLTLSNACLICE